MGRRAGRWRTRCRGYAKDISKVYDNTNSVVSQFVSNDTYKLTRATWYALFALDMGRHDALLAEDIPDVYRRLFDHILAGTLPAEDDPEGLQLLDFVTNKLPQPRKISRTLPQLNPDDLGTALFGKVATELEISGLGIGPWPDTPAHTCEANTAVGTVLTIRPGRASATRIYNPTHRTCDACLHERAKRICRQVLAEMAVHGIMFYQVMTEGDFGKWTARIRQYRKRTGADVHYRALPYGDGLVFVMATAGGIAGPQVPVIRKDLHDLIVTYANTPEGHNTSASHGFGGKWQGTRGDGREVDDDRREATAAKMRMKDYREQKKLAGGGAIQRWTDSPLEDVAKAIGKPLKENANRLSLQIKKADLFAKLDEGGIKLREKRYAAGVTNSAQRKTKRKNCAKVVTDEAQLPTVPLPYPTNGGADDPQEVPIWDIYLP